MRRYTSVNDRTDPLPFGPAIPARPLDVLVTGAVLALGTLAAIGAIAYHAWYLRDLPENAAIFVCGLLFFVYAAGVYVFSYGWERYDVERAVRLTAVIVVLSAAGFLLLVLLLKLSGRAAGGGQSAGAGDASEVDLGPALRTVGSFVQSGRLEAEDEAEPEPESDLYTMTCGRCQERYIPLPPRAICPHCGWAAVTVA